MIVLPKKPRLKHCRATASGEREASWPSLLDRNAGARRAVLASRPCRSQKLFRLTALWNAILLNRDPASPTHSQAAGYCDKIKKIAAYCKHDR